MPILLPSAIFSMSIYFPLSMSILHLLLSCFIEARSGLERHYLDEFVYIVRWQDTSQFDQGNKLIELN